MIQTVFEGRGRRSAVDGGLAARIRALVPQGMREAIVFNANTEDGAAQIRRLVEDGYQVLDLAGKLSSGDAPPNMVVMVIPLAVWQDNKQLAFHEAKNRIHTPVDFAASGVFDKDIRVTKDEHVDGHAFSLKELDPSGPASLNRGSDGPSESPNK